jgi:PadR family transcriptional regulator, regulatory protein AphA
MDWLRLALRLAPLTDHQIRIYSFSEYISMTRSYTSALSPEYALLGFLAQAPAHGYELHQRLTRELGQVWHVSLSQTYNILKRLEGQGDIHGKLLLQEKLPPRQHYHLTRRGRQRWEEWLNKPTGSSVRAIRVEFITRLYFAPLLGEQKPTQLIQAQIEETRRGMERLKGLLEQAPAEQTFNRLGLDLRLRQLQAVLDWLEGVEAEFGLLAGNYDGRNTR